MLFSIIFLFLVMALVAKLITLAVRLSWGIFKIIGFIVIAPFILIALAFSGFAVIAVVGLLIGAVVSLLAPAR